METKIITFNAEARNEILSFFDKTVDKERFIIEKGDQTQRIITPDGEEIRISEFTGIRKGSFIKSDLPSLIELSDVLN